MTGSWTDDELPNTPHAEHIYGGGPNPNVSEYPDEPPADKPRLQKLLEENPRFGAPLRFYPEASVNDAIAANERRRQNTERREQMRTEELERMDRLAARIEKGIEEDVVDLESGATMLLNVSRARAALGGVGTYPGAF